MLNEIEMNDEINFNKNRKRFDEFDDIRSEFNTSKIKLDVENIVTDEDLLNTSLRFYLTGKDKMSFLQKKVTPAFLFNLINVIRKVIGCLIASLLFLFIPGKIK